MSPSRLFRWLPVMVGAIVFGASLWVIRQELQQHSAAEIWQALSAIPLPRLWGAIGLTGLNYGVMTGYDTLAVRSVRAALPFSKTALTAIISYGISNMVGLALLSSSAIRYRFYRRDLSPLQIAQAIAFCNFSFWLGLFAVAGGVFLLQPVAIPAQLKLPFTSVQPLGLIFLTLLLVYVGWNALSTNAISIGHWVLPHLPLNLCLGQIAIAAGDWLLAAAVLYVLLPNPLDFPSFFGIYLLAQIAGIISNVPGGLGIFETVMLLLLPHPSATPLLSLLLAYRGIYYLLPLLLSMLLWGGWEMRSKGHG